MIDDLMARTSVLEADSEVFRASAKKKSGGGGFFASVGSAVSGFFGGGGGSAAPPPPPASAPKAYEGMGNFSPQSNVSESRSRLRAGPAAGKRGHAKREDAAILADQSRDIADMEEELAKVNDLFSEVGGMVQEQGWKD
jgi:hypothetical protein